VLATRNRQPATVILNKLFTILTYMTSSKKSSVGSGLYGVCCFYFYHACCLPVLYSLPFFKRTPKSTLAPNSVAAVDVGVFARGGVPVESERERDF
jgi:hypothetical protein